MTMRTHQALPCETPVNGEGIVACCLIPTSSQSWKESGYFRNPIKMSLFSSTTDAQSDKAGKHLSIEIWLLKRMPLPVWVLSGRRGLAFRRRLLQTVLLCPSVSLGWQPGLGMRQQGMWAAILRTQSKLQIMSTAFQAKCDVENWFYENYKKYFNISVMI